MYKRQRFPDVAFEGCSGGGGRFDAGMLYYMPQTWTSDDSDAIERLKIQYGTSFAYPPQCMTAHISASPNHQMGRVTPYDTRARVAMSASFGYELDVYKRQQFGCPKRFPLMDRDVSIKLNRKMPATFQPAPSLQMVTLPSTHRAS